MSNKTLTPLEIRKGHVIQAIRFIKGEPAELAPTECICGWMGPGGAFAEHRKEMGATSSGGTSGYIKVTPYGERRPNTKPLTVVPGHSKRRVPY